MAKGAVGVRVTASSGPGSTTFSLSVSLRPVLATGAACDPAQVQNRCGAGGVQSHPALPSASPHDWQMWAGAGGALMPKQCGQGCPTARPCSQPSVMGGAGGGWRAAR